MIADPNFSTLRKIAAGLYVSLDYLLHSQQAARTAQAHQRRMKYGFYSPARYQQDSRYHPPRDGTTAVVWGAAAHFYYEHTA